MNKVCYYCFKCDNILCDICIEEKLHLNHNISCSDVSVVYYFYFSKFNKIKQLLNSKENIVNWGDSVFEMHQ